MRFITLLFVAIVFLSSCKARNASQVRSGSSLGSYVEPELRQPLAVIENDKASPEERCEAAWSLVAISRLHRFGQNPSLMASAFPVLRRAIHLVDVLVPRREKIDGKEVVSYPPSHTLASCASAALGQLGARAVAFIVSEIEKEVQGRPWADIKDEQDQLRELFQALGYAGRMVEDAEGEELALEYLASVLEGSTRPRLQSSAAYALSDIAINAEHPMTAAKKIASTHLRFANDSNDDRYWVYWGSVNAINRMKANPQRNKFEKLVEKIKTVDDFKTFLALVHSLGPKGVDVLPQLLNAWKKMNLEIQTTHLTLSELKQQTTEILVIWGEGGIASVQHVSEQIMEGFVDESYIATMGYDYFLTAVSDSLLKLGESSSIAARTLFAFADKTFWQKNVRNLSSLSIKSALSRNEMGALFANAFARNFLVPRSYEFAIPDANRRFEPEMRTALGDAMVDWVWRNQGRDLADSEVRDSYRTATTWLLELSKDSLSASSLIVDILGNDRHALNAAYIYQIESSLTSIDPTTVSTVIIEALKRQASSPDDLIRNRARNILTGMSSMVISKQNDATGVVEFVERLN